MVCTPDILLKNDCTNFNLKKRTAPEKKFFLIISLKQVIIREITQKIVFV